MDKFSEFFRNSIPSGSTSWQKTNGKYVESAFKSQSQLTSLDGSNGTWQQ